MASVRLTYTSHPGTTREFELSALAAVYRFLILEKGGRNDLTGTSTKEWTTSQDKKGNENADIHGN